MSEKRVRLYCSSHREGNACLKVYNHPRWFMISLFQLSFAFPDGFEVILSNKLLILCLF